MPSTLRVLIQLVLPVIPGVRSLFILQMKKRRHREVKKLPLGHTVRQWKSHDSNPGSLVSRLCVWLWLPD